MGTHFLPLSFSLSSFTSSNPKNPKVPINPVRRSSISSRARAIPHDDSNAETFRSGRSRFSFDDDLFTDDEQGFDFGTAAKQRIWWSDDVDDEEEEDEDDEFWIFKVLKAFGWMVPAVGISMLLGTGPNALLMAIALPLGQSILSFAIDKAWPTKDSPRPRPRPRPKSRKKPFTKKSSNNKAQEENNIPYEKGREANYRSVNMGKKSTSGYGGWDELVNEKGTEEKSGTVINQKMGGFSKERSKSKLTRRGRNRDTPLVVRLLVAVFPFLGSWTRLFL